MQRSIVSFPRLSASDDWWAASFLLVFEVFLTATQARLATPKLQQVAAAPSIRIHPPQLHLHNLSGNLNSCSYSKNVWVVCRPGALHCSVRFAIGFGSFKVGAIANSSKYNFKSSVMGTLIKLCLSVPVHNLLKPSLGLFQM
jgi:hypothetical protein